jgi:orotidine-5'-phosphate decarboxylase
MPDSERLNPTFPAEYPALLDKIYLARQRLIVALDVPTAAASAELAKKLEGTCQWFKVGLELFTAAGPAALEPLIAHGNSIFLDLKFHDIPNTVAKAVTAAVQLDVQMLTVHTSGGLEMLKAAEQAAEEVAWKLGRIPPLVLGVTVLTSLDIAALREIGLDVNVEYQVRRLATVATKAGLRGLVCSPQEVVKLRQAIPPAMQLVTPGIRTGTEKADDQKRTLTPKEAIQAGANWLVIGRPIYAAENPRAAAEKILESLS